MWFTKILSPRKISVSVDLCISKIYTPNALTKKYLKGFPKHYVLWNEIVWNAWKYAYAKYVNLAYWEKKLSSINILKFNFSKSFRAISNKYLGNLFNYFIIRVQDKVVLYINVILNIKIMIYSSTEWNWGDLKWVGITSISFQYLSMCFSLNDVSKTCN